MAPVRRALGNATTESQEGKKMDDNITQLIMELSLHPNVSRPNRL
jgi:hypothetical protein